jgi:hypothetical protein
MVKAGVLLMILLTLKITAVAVGMPPEHILPCGHYIGPATV